MRKKSPVPVPLDEWRRLHRPSLPHKVLRDPEVRAFVDKSLDSYTFERLAEACLVLFGPARAPSRSSLHRYYAAFRRP